MKLYHITSLKNADNIIKNGLNSHSWLATNKKRCLVYGELNTFSGMGLQVILKFNLSVKEINERLLVSQNAPDIGTEVLLHSYKMKKLKPCEVSNI